MTTGCLSQISWRWTENDRRLAKRKGVGFAQSCRGMEMQGGRTCKRKDARAWQWLTLGLFVVVAVGVLAQVVIEGEAT